MGLKRFVVAVLAAALALPVTTSAAGALPVELRHIAMLLLVQAADGAFAALDTNQDGYIDRGEAGRLPDVLVDFDRVDGDGDGRISPDEWVAYDRQAS